MNQTIYMDHNATSPLRVEAKEALIAALGLGGNPSSVHGPGRKARQAIETAREQVRAAINAPKSAQVIFTSCGTEANTLALNGPEQTRVLASATEHASILSACKDIENLPVDAHGRIDLGHLQSLLSRGDGHVVVSVMMANNETGVLQNIEDITHLAHRFGALIHVDAVQALGKIEVDFLALGVDMMSLSAHKIGGPLGIGALIASKDVKLAPANRGGGQEGGLRGGTENISGIAGFGAAAGLVKDDVADAAPVKALRDKMEAKLLQLAPEVTIFGSDVARLPNTSFIAMPGVNAETQVMAMDLAGICVSAGSACASGKSKTSAVLAAMGVDPEIAKTAVRVSLGHASTIDHIEKFVAVWKDLYERVAAKRNAA